MQYPLAVQDTFSGRRRLSHYPGVTNASAPIARGAWLRSDVRVSFSQRDGLDVRDCDDWRTAHEAGVKDHVLLVQQGHGAKEGRGLGLNDDELPDEAGDNARHGLLLWGRCRCNTVTPVDHPQWRA